MEREEIMMESEQKKRGFWHNNAGVGVVEIILILVVIFTIYMGCK